MLTNWFINRLLGWSLNALTFLTLYKDCVSSLKKTFAHCSFVQSLYVFNIVSVIAFFKSSFFIGLRVFRLSCTRLRILLNTTCRKPGFNSLRTPLNHGAEQASNEILKPTQQRNWSKCFPGRASCTKRTLCSIALRDRKHNATAAGRTQGHNGLQDCRRHYVARTRKSYIHHIDQLRFKVVRSLLTLEELIRISCSFKSGLHTSLVWRDFFHFVGVMKHRL